MNESRAAAALQRHAQQAERLAADARGVVNNIGRLDPKVALALLVGRLEEHARAMRAEADEVTAG